VRARLLPADARPSLNRRREPQQNGRRHRHQRGEAQDRAVYRDFLQAWDSRGRQHKQQADSTDCESDSGYAGECRKQDAFAQQLPDEPTSPRAQSPAKGKFMLASGAARQ